MGRSGAWQMIATTSIIRRRLCGGTRYDPSTGSALSNGPTLLVNARCASSMWASTVAAMRFPTWSFSSLSRMFRGLPVWIPSPDRSLEASPATVSLRMDRRSSSCSGSWRPPARRLR